MRSSSIILWALNRSSYEVLNNNILLATVPVGLTDDYLRFMVDGDATCPRIYVFPMKFTANAKLYGFDLK